MTKQNVIICQDLEQDLTRVLQELRWDRLFLLTDETTHRLCQPLISGFSFMKGAHEIIIGAGDAHKELDTLAHVWMELSTHGASRHSLMVNLGGGMVTDLGGFAASTFKRGIPYINIPTTLLSMVDAAVGGKTGINFNGLKNEIGAFAPAQAVLLETEFLRTLDADNFFSGYAEMLKHGLISTKETLYELLAYDTDHIDYVQLKDMVRQSVEVKEHIVEIDPKEQGIRKALNLGHTFGHAFESWALKQQTPVLHGYAVAWGLICELYLSVVTQRQSCARRSPLVASIERAPPTRSARSSTSALVTSTVTFSGIQSDGKVSTRSFPGVVVCRAEQKRRDKVPFSSFQQSF